MSEKLLKCPFCNTEINRHSNVDSTNDLPPNDGDFSICFHCHNVSYYVVENKQIVTLQQLTRDMFESLDAEEQQNINSVLSSLQIYKQIKSVEDDES